MASDGIFIFINWLIEHCFRTALRVVMREHASVLHVPSPSVSIHSGHRCRRLSSILIPNASNIVWRFTLLRLALIFAFCRGPREGRRWLLSGRALLDFLPDAACRELHREWVNTLSRSTAKNKAEHQVKKRHHPIQGLQIPLQIRLDLYWEPES